MGRVPDLLQMTIRGNIIINELMILMLSAGVELRLAAHQCTLGQKLFSLGAKLPEYWPIDTLSIGAQINLQQRS
jgi:hypothetical protein